MSARPTRAYEKYAWIVLFFIGLVFLVRGFAVNFGLYGLGNRPEPDTFANLTNMTWDEVVATSPPAVASLVGLLYRAWGVTQLALSAVVMAISAVPYRKGEKWAWFTSWIVLVPLLFTAFGFGDVQRGQINGVAMMFVIVALAGLFLPYRKFFPKVSVTF